MKMLSDRLKINEVNTFYMSFPILFPLEGNESIEYHDFYRISIFLFCNPSV